MVLIHGATNKSKTPQNKTKNKITNQPKFHGPPSRNKVTIGINLLNLT